MKHISLLLMLSLFLSNESFAQKLNPVSWTFEVNHLDGEQYEFVAKAAMEDQWVIYSQHMDNSGPIPTAFVFDNNEEIDLLGDTKEVSVPVKGHSDLFDMEVIKFKDEAVFEQKFTSSSGNSKLTGYVRFMTCDSQRCLPPKEVPFEISF